VLKCTRFLFTCDIQLSDGTCFKTWDQVQAEGRAMPWLLTGHGSSWLEESHREAQRWIKLSSLRFSTAVRTFFLSFHIAFEVENAEHIKYPRSTSVPLLFKRLSKKNGLPRLLRTALDQKSFEMMGCRNEERSGCFDQTMILLVI
jgi:hypothetical protein